MALRALQSASVTSDSGSPVVFALTKKARARNLLLAPPRLLLSAAVPLIRPHPPGPRQAPIVTWTGRCYAPNRFTTRRRSEVYCFRLLFEKRRQRHQYSTATMSAAAAAAPELSQEQSFARRLPKIEVSCTRPASKPARATVRNTNRARLSCTHT